MDNLTLLYDSRYGVYIPQMFAEELGDLIVNASEYTEDIAILKRGHETDGYWEAWEHVSFWCQLLDPQGKLYYLFQHDGDLWAVDYNTEIPEDWP